MPANLHLPAELERALDDAVSVVAFSALRAAASDLSDAYRTSRTPGQVGPPPDDVAVLAYAATRMPATLAVARFVLRELRSRCPALPVERVLDLGSGPGTTLWAAASEIRELIDVTLVEPAPAMMAVGQRLLRGSSLDERLVTSWYSRAVDVPGTAEAYDLVVAGYLLTELDGASRHSLIDLAWERCRGAVVVILPGSTQGYRAMLDARARLLSHGATVVAPCPHAGSCPLPDDDWCHFAVRLNRSSLHRRLKGGTLPYEDEKYTYLVATRGIGLPAEARVLRRPRKQERRVTLRLCGAEGVRDELVTRTDRRLYRRARKVRWGEDWTGD